MSKLSVSDMFRKFLVLSTLDRIFSEDIMEHSKRPAEFLKEKNGKANVVSIRNKTICCGR
ncbi:MAG: hypothetical protein A2Z47_08245 [Thermodesulfovibrio sp. RBG_19FT_COMBO_42_12]|nr:MAG: hypothetical protein A2Z47_08245 [Thermodesulfovibrio sp. RBG_19FT_COMBO_42_12]